jgi:hypothetical protein
MSSYAQLDKSKIARPGIISGKVIDQISKELLPILKISQPIRPPLNHFLRVILIT